MKKTFIFCLVAMIATLWNGSIAQNAGTLDPTFGTNGIAQTAIGDADFLVDAIQNIVVQPDSKIIALGSTKTGTYKHVALVRYNPDGSTDDSFGKSGQAVIIPTELYGNFAMDAEVLSDGKIVVCGYVLDSKTYVSQILLMRLNANGSLDTSFGTNGVVVTNYGVAALAEKMVLQPDGKILLGGYYNDNLTAFRFNADGTPDNTFGTSGYVAIEIENSVNNSFAKNIDIQADGKIILVGFYSEQPTFKGVVARLNTNGTLDNTFGTNGLAKFKIGTGPDFITAVKTLENGKILIGGHSWVANNPYLQYSLFIAELNEDGSYYNDFATNGIFKHQIEKEGENYVTDLAVHSKGNIYASIRIVKGNILEDIGLVSLKPNGTPNTSFGTEGVVRTDINGSSDSPLALAFQPNGKLVVGATSINASGTKFTVLRYLTDVETNLNEVSTDPVNSFISYPNPVIETLYIQSDSNIDKIEVYNMLGTRVAYALNAKEINIANLAAGVYVVQVHTNKGINTGRVIKK